MLTCTGVSFAHGSNDGQKGMGLIMLILIGTVPTAYALNHAVTAQQTQDFVAVSQQAADMLSTYVTPDAVVGDPRDEVTDLHSHQEFTPNTMLALRDMVNDIGTEMAHVQGAEARAAGSRAQLPQRHVRGQRSAAPDAEVGQAEFPPADAAVLENYKKHID